MSNTFKAHFNRQRIEDMQKKKAFREKFSDQNVYNEYLESIYKNKIGQVYGYTDHYISGNLVPFLEVKIVRVYGIPKMEDTIPLVSFKMEVLKIKHYNIYKANPLLNSIEEEKRKNKNIIPLFSLFKCFSMKDWLYRYYLDNNVSYQNLGTEYAGEYRFLIDSEFSKEETERFDNVKDFLA